LAAEQTGRPLPPRLLPVSTALDTPIDLRLIVHDTLSDSYESSSVLLAKAGFDGTLQLLTSAWERVLGYGREEFKDKTLFHFMWSNPRSTAAAAAAIMDELDMGSVDLRLRCRDGRGKGLTLHRLYDKDEHMIYIVAEETPAERMGARLGVICAREERRAHPRPDVGAAHASVSAQTRRLARATLASTRAASKTRELTVKTPSPFDKPLAQSTGRKFAEMTRGQKFIFVMKLVVCIATFGFVFPNVQHD
jgi:PAS domain-containing protein